MRLRQAELGFFNLLLLPNVVSSLTLDCGHVRAGGQSFNFKSLGGPRSTYHEDPTPPTTTNTTYTIDLCAQLQVVDGLKREQQCPRGTRVCGIEYIYDEEGTKSIAEAIPLAGSFIDRYNLHLEPSYTRLKDSDSAADADKEGVRIELNGGRYPIDRRDGQKQKVFLEMLCDRNRTGLEGVSGDGRVPLDDKRSKLSTRKYTEDDDDEDEDPDDDGDDGGDGSEDDEGDERSLKFISYRPQGEGKKEINVLRLEWRTKWACEGMADQSGDDEDDEDGKNKHWGFFIWFIIILFLAVAAYLIFGSWLNYNRYGARGWDLLPHGDTIRDIPYIVKDWGRRVVSAVQGPGSRGGYSAV